MRKADDFTVCVDVDEFSQDVTRVEDLSDRVRLAGYGLAAPLVEARGAQMQREVARTAKRKGANHPEVALRQANADRATTTEFGKLASDFRIRRDVAPRPEVPGVVAVEWAAAIPGHQGHRIGVGRDGHRLRIGTRLDR